MKLLTAAILSKLEKSPLYTHEKTKIEDIPIIFKLFNPCGSGSWYVTEGQKQDNGDWLFYGLVDLHEKELGYFTLSELMSVKLPFGLKIERDKWFENKKLVDVM